MTIDGLHAPPPKVVEVAVAVIFAPNRRVLLAQRPAGKPMAGYWEFPGGKLEPGESVIEALRREIDEELGLHIEHADPWVVLPFVYPHATVRLHFMRVTRFSGTPRSREQQAFRFEPIDQFSAEPWLPGALPLKRWLKLPPRVALSNGFEEGAARYLDRLSQHLKKKPDPFWLVLREPGLSDAAFAAFFDAVMPVARAFGLTVLVSSRHDRRFWTLADGVQLTAQDLLASRVRPPVRWCLASCHGSQDLAMAARLGADAALFGAVFETASHPKRTPLHWSGFEEVVKNTPLPVLALGGLRFDAVTLGAAMRHGAHGVAAQRGAF